MNIILPARGDEDVQTKPRLQHTIDILWGDNSLNGFIYKYASEQPDNEYTKDGANDLFTYMRPQSLSQRRHLRTSTRRHPKLSRDVGGLSAIHSANRLQKFTLRSSSCIVLPHLIRKLAKSDIKCAALHDRSFRQNTRQTGTTLLGHDS